MNKRWSSGLLAVAISLATPGLAAGSRYVVTSVTTTNLGTFGGNRSAALDINAAGNIVGWADIPGDIPHAFLRQGASMHDLAYALPTGGSSANGINDSGRVVGTHYPMSTTAEEYHAFQWVSGAVTFLDDAHPSPRVRANSSANAVASTGVSAGSRHWGNCDNYFSTVWANPSHFITLLEGPACWGNFATDINSQSTVIGYDLNLDVGLYWRFVLFGFARGVVPLPPSSTGSSFVVTHPTGLNNAGTVVGYFEDGSRVKAFLWDGVAASSRDLGVIPTGTFARANDINEGNFIAGYGNKLTSVSPGSPLVQQTFAFLYNDSLGYFALPRPTNMAATAECRANALNERRSNGVIEVVGSCDTLSGQRAMRWSVTVAIAPPS